MLIRASLAISLGTVDRVGVMQGRRDYGIGHRGLVVYGGWGLGQVLFHGISFSRGHAMCPPLPNKKRCSPRKRLGQGSKK
jgi:hypothetical protein